MNTVEMLDELQNKALHDEKVKKQVFKDKGRGRFPGGFLPCLPGTGI